MRELEVKITKSFTMKLTMMTSTIEPTMPYRPVKLKRMVSSNCEAIRVIADRVANPKLGRAFFKKRIAVYQSVAR